MNTTLRHVEPTKTTDSSLQPRLTKNAERREKFRKIGAAISSLKRNSEDRDYHTGKESQFHLVTAPVQDSTLTSRLCGPKMKTQQFIRTLYLKKKTNG